MDNQLNKILINTPLFKGFTEEALNSLLPLLNAEKITFSSNSCIATEGHSIAFFPVILSGEVHITKTNHLGETQILSKLHVGDIFGEVGAFSTIGKWPATATAYKEVQLYAFPIQEVLTIDSKHPLLKQQLLLNIIGMLSLKTYGLNQKVGYLQLKSIRGKLAKYFLHCATQAQNLSFTIPFNRQELADYLSISRPSMSREMGDMKEEGIIDYYKSSIKILDKEALESI